MPVTLNPGPGPYTVWPMRRHATTSSWQRAGVLCLAAIAALWLTVGAAWGQQKDAIPTLTESKAAAEWAIGSAFLVGCLVVAFKNSKRSQLH